MNDVVMCSYCYQDFPESVGKDCRPGDDGYCIACGKNLEEFIDDDDE